MKRRDFLYSSGWFVVGATLAGIPGCGDNRNTPSDAEPGPGRDAPGRDAPGPDAAADGPDQDAPADAPAVEPAGTFSFPQGVASGDPRATLGRAVDPRRTRQRPRRRRAAASRSPATRRSATVVVDKPLTATADSRPHGARAGHRARGRRPRYFYRFVAGHDAIERPDPHRARRGRRRPGQPRVGVVPGLQRRQLRRVPPDDRRRRRAAPTPTRSTPSSTSAT